MNNDFLFKNDIPIAKPIAFAEKRFASIIFEQALVFENLKNAPRLKDYIDDLSTLQEKVIWMKKSIELAHLLHEKACYHLDFHHRNILFVNENAHLIDNEKLVFCGQPREDLLAVMLGRLGFGLRDDISEQAYYRAMAKPSKHRGIFYKAFEGKLSGKKLAAVISNHSFTKE